MNGIVGFILLITLLIVGITLVIVSNRDFADDKHRSRTFARVLGILSIIGASISILVMIGMFIAGVGSKSKPEPGFKEFKELK